MNEDIGLLLIRVFTGMFFAAHGSQMLFGLFGGRGIRAVRTNFHNRGFRPSLPFALSAAGTEFFGGLGVAFGFLWPLPAIALIGPMTVAVFGVHWPKVWVTENGIEYPLVLGFIMAGIGLLGPGELSLDHALGISLPQGALYTVTLVGAVVVALGAIFAARNVKRKEAASAPAGASAGS